jgi:hypothetical protein
MTVDVVTVNELEGDCETTYTAKTTDEECTNPVCVWRDPSNNVIDTGGSCSLTLGADDPTGEYCVTVTCGTEEDCPHNCGEGKNPPCQDRAATCCVTFDAPDAPDCIINTGPTTLCENTSQQYCETGGATYTEYDWSVTGSCTITSGGGPTDSCVTITTTTAGNCLIELDATTADGCVAHCEKRITVEVCVGGEGCTPGFWKQAHHFGHWPDQYCPTDECCGEATEFCEVFDCSTSGGCQTAVNNAYAGKTLLQVLGQGGGGFKALGRHAVAGLLNSKTIEYGIDDVIGLVNDAIDDCDPGPAHQDLAEENELGCPLGGQAPCTDFDLNGGSDNQDLQILLGNWGRPGIGDIDHNGIVGPNDLAILLANWGNF